MKLPPTLNKSTPKSPTNPPTTLNKIHQQMNTLSAEQIQTIQYYWHQLDRLNRKLYKINLKETAIYSQIDDLKPFGL